MGEREIKGKIILITGAADGLGAAFAEAFLKGGAKHVALLDISEEQGRATESRLRSVYGEEAAWFTPCDVSSEQQLTAAYSAVLDKFRRIDVVINNAGIMDEKRPLRTIEINLSALVSSSYKAMEAMRADRGGAGGTIVNIASLAAVKPLFTIPVYCATKAAVLMFSNSIGLPARYASTKVRVLAMCYGLTDTNIDNNAEAKMYDREAVEYRAQYINKLEVQRVESAVAAMLEMFARGDSGSTWSSRGDLPVKDISDKVREREQINMI